MIRIMPMRYTETFGLCVRASLSLILGGTLHDEAIMQTSLGVKSGGLGLRHAVDTACPSSIASKIAARPIVARLAAGLQSLDMLPEGLERDYNNSLTSAVLDFKSTLDPSSVETVDELILKEAMFVEK